MLLASRLPNRDLLTPHGGLEVNRHVENHRPTFVQSLQHREPNVLGGTVRSAKVDESCSRWCHSRPLVDVLFMGVIGAVCIPDQQQKWGSCADCLVESRQGVGQPRAMSHRGHTQPSRHSRISVGGAHGTVLTVHRYVAHTVPLDEFVNQHQIAVTQEPEHVRHAPLGNGLSQDGVRGSSVLSHGSDRL